jgi:high affinity sulfate transporter 1
MKAQTSTTSRFDLFQGILPIQRQEIWKDVVAGITLAALGIPEVMGYTRIAQTPVVTGLYTLVLPVIVFAVLGSSRHLVVAADSATAAILAGALVSYAVPYSPDYVALTGLLALLCAGVIVLARILRLGFLADFLSRSALMGFLTGVGIQVASDELGSLLGIPKAGHGTVAKLLHTFWNLDHIQWWTALVGLSVFGIIVILGHLAPRFPGALLAVIGAIMVSAVFHLQSHGIETIGSVPSGLPHLALPHGQWTLVPTLLATAVSCTIVIIAQSAATSRSYALRFNDTFDENRDLIGLAVANVAATVTGTFVVNGSPTKTEMVEMADGRSQVAQLTTSAIILLVLLFLTRPLSFMPAVVLSAVVFLIGVRLIDVTGLRDLYRRRRDEFWIATTTAAAVAFVGVEQAILAAIAISVVDHLRISYRPPTRLLKLSDGGTIVAAPISSEAMALPGLLVYRFEAPIYYANANFFMTEVLRLVQATDYPVRWLIVRFDSISDIDYSASKMLLNLIQRLRDLGVNAVFTDVDARIEKLLKSYGLAMALGSERVFVSFGQAVEAFKRLPSAPEASAASKKSAQLSTS